jgi:Fur family ferric uptake transcriptional regulator
MTAPAPDELTQSIRGAGLKVTEPRVAVLKALHEHPHSDADTVFGHVRQNLTGTSLQAVYGVLAALTTAGLLRKIEPAGSSALYERRIGDNHHHLVCSGCGVVHDVDCVVGEAPCLTPSSGAGFAIHTAEVTFWGLCPACQQDQAAMPEPTPNMKERS